MIDVVKIRELTLEQASSAGRQPFLSAASGLVCIGGQAYVVADDELHLGQFNLDTAEPGQLLRLFEGELPGDKRERKALKPDFEVLIWLPPQADATQFNYPYGALLALGSGSKPNRCSGVLLSVNAQGAINGEPQRLPLQNLYAALAVHVDDLNIEGAVVSGDTLFLMQRGSKGSRCNALLSLPLAELRTLLRDPAHEIHIARHNIQSFELGEIEGVPYSFTDGAALPNGDFLYTAVAENTDDSYRDGACLGAVIGVASLDGTVKWQQPLAQPHKVEGVSVRVEGESLQVLLVTDADDPSVPALLLSAQIDNWQR